jgi:anti-repressor protein
MNELIKIQEKEGKQVVSARDLYDFLEVKERFSRFMERNFEYGFIENIDYTPYQNVHPLNNQIIEDFILTLDCAKEISMVQRTEKGKQARQYFIQCEKQLIEAKPKLPVTYKDALKQLVAEIEEKEKLQEENLFLIANNENLAIELDEHKAWYSVKRVCLLGYFKNKDAKTLWQPLKAYSIANNYQIKGIFDANYGEVKTYHKEVWKAVYNINL